MLGILIIFVETNATKFLLQCLESQNPVLSETSQRFILSVAGRNEVSHTLLRDQLFSVILLELGPVIINVSSRCRTYNEVEAVGYTLHFPRFRIKARCVLRLIVVHGAVPGKNNGLQIIDLEGVAQAEIKIVLNAGVIGAIKAIEEPTMIIGL